MKPLEEFVRQRLPDIVRKIERDNIGAAVTELNVYEKALIYYYSIEGYEQLNEDLRDGKSNEYEAYLNEALDKLPNYERTIFRGADLTETQIDEYKKAFSEGEFIIKYAFTSASKSYYIAQQFSKGSVVFEIKSQTGKAIGQLSFYQESQNESEILFKSKSVFRVLGVDDSQHFTTIFLEEIYNE